MSISAETIEKAKEIFLGDRFMSLEKLSDASEDLLGQKIAFENLKKYAQRGNWSHEKQILHQAEETGDDITKEVEAIRRVLFDQITTANRGGLLIVGETSDDLEAKLNELLEGYPDLDWVKVNPGAVNATWVNAYMNLLDKANIGISSGASAKTSYQQALEIARKASRE